MSDMQVQVNWSLEVSKQFPALTICVGAIRNIHNERANEKIEQIKKSVYEEVKTKYDIATLKDHPIVRAYRDFYWKLNIDPTKTRPSGEALLRRVLHGEELPKISTAVDAYNLVSMKTIIPISGFDADCLNTPLEIRYSKNEEAFLGIGMNKPISLENTLVLADTKQVLCVYPYRDSEFTKITMQTRNALIISYGVPAVSEQQLKEAVEKTLTYIKQVSQGEIEEVKAFSSSH